MSQLTTYDLDYRLRSSPKYARLPALERCPSGMLGFIPSLEVSLQGVSALVIPGGSNRSLSRVDTAYGSNPRTATCFRSPLPCSVAHAFRGPRAGASNFTDATIDFFEIQS
jgi:hypothetical protein